MADTVSSPANIMSFNATNSSFAHDFLLAVPRLARRAGVFAINYIPEQLDGLFGKVLTPSRFTADATTMGSTSSNLSIPTASSSAASLASSAASESTLGAADSALKSSSWSAMLLPLDIFKGLVSLGSYFLTKWAMMSLMVVCANHSGCGANANNGSP